MGVSNYTPTGISHATSVDFSKRSVNQPVHIVQYDRSLPILAISLYNNGQLYRLSESMEVSIRFGKPDRTFVCNKALGCDSTRTIVYFEITQQMSLFDGEFYPVIEIVDGEKISNSSTIYLVVDRNPVQHDYIESTIEYKELIDYRDEAVNAGNEAKEAAKIAKASEEASKLSETNAKEYENESVKYSNLAKSYAVGTDNTIRENDAEDNAKTYCETAKISATNAKQSETNAKTYLDKIIEKVDVVVDTEMSDTSENPVQNKVIKAYVDEHTPEVADMTGATATQNGAHGLVPAPQIGDEKKALLGDGTWGSVDAILTFKTKEEYDTAVANDEIPDGAKVIKEYDEGDSTVIIVVDTVMSDTSENPVQNKVIKKYVDEHTPEVSDMTGATADKDGTSGTVPAPMAGQESLFLRGDGTWAKASGGSSIAPKATVDPAISSGNAKVTISWGDPEDVVLDGAVLSAWKGTKLVMKESGYPDNESDGALILDNMIRDAYKTSGYVVDGLINGNTYYFKLFPYSTDGIYNYQDSNKLLGNPSLVKLDPCTNMSLSLEMGSVTVSWTDPDAEKTVDENTATWAKTVLVYKQGSTAPSSVSDGIVAVEETTRNQYSVDGFTVDGLTDGEQYSFALFAVSTEGVSSDATTATANLWATLTITTDETKLYEKEVTATYGSSTVSGTFNSIGSVTLQIPWIGETTITSTDGTDTATSVVTISAYESTYSVDLSFFKIVTFADGTDKEIAKMIQAHYDNKINIADYWAVGDTRNIDLSAMSATGVGESHRAQTVQFVIGDFEHDDLATPINGHTKAAVTLLQKDCLMDASNASNPVNGSTNTENGYMNSTHTNAGGWKGCARRTWCNNVYFNALPSALQSMVKTVNKKTCTGGGSLSGTEVTADKIFLAAEIEIFGSNTYSGIGEGTQYQYYKNATANIYKMPKWNSSFVTNIYWERSTRPGHGDGFCIVYASGRGEGNIAGVANGVAPCLCI